ncbi:uncharacterized protein LOC110928419 [Helianthus annuus]|uniref:uncharacterized protein LOC110928419 n=1 Tax=Helianthus annuus TaxID=4232 RepID=UPI001653272F|nr:uncharacterized protein LOC110928419 [Helianthus annuus]
MDENTVTFLNNLDWRSKLFTIKVKVLRLWIRVNPKREGETLGIEMVVMDEQGTRMQCENFDGSVYGIRLASFESIKAGEVDVKYRVDYIGYVDEWSEPEMTKTKMGKDSKFMNLQLLDEEGIKLNCTLWDEYCDEMFGYIQSHKEVHVVLLVQFGSFNKYKGKTTLSNAFHITRLFINADIEEIRSFRTKFVEKICKTSSDGQKSIGSSGSTSVADDFLVKHPFSNFRDITLLDKPCEVIVLGTIMGVDDKDDWYYLGCEECNRKVETTLVIEEAEDGAEELKFKQDSIRVQDYAAIASLTLFDREARKMLVMTAIQLLEKSRVDQASLEEKTIPYQFRALNDKIMLSRFKLVKLILTTILMLSQLLMFHLVIYQLKTLFALKDAVDSIGDSFTPDCTSKDCSKTSSAELKRNLADVYEVEESTSLSSTKVKKADVSDVQIDEETILLYMPKLAKPQTLPSFPLPTGVQPSNSSVGRSPLSNITNVDPNQVEHQDYVERRKLRKLYLDNKRKNANNKSSTSQNVIRSSNVSVSDTNDCRVVTPIHSSSYNNTMDGLAYNDVEHQKSAERRKSKKVHLDNKRHNVTNKFSTSQNVIRSSNVSVPDTNDCRVVTPILVTGRSPLANITNVASNDLEHQQSAERRKYRKLHLENKRHNVSNKSSTSKIVTRSFNVSVSNTNECRIVTPMSSSSYIHTIDPRCLPTTPITSPSEASTSGVKRIQRGKQRLSTKGRCVYPVPMVDLSSVDHIIPKKIVEDPYKGVSNNYLDHGDQVVVCDVCNAKLWKVEAGKGRVYLGRKSYMLCCGYGNVHLPNFKETRQEYQNLFKSLDDKSKHFLLNIRRFNSMFSFTSMGGKVDSKINRGNSPYVYRISGENYHTLGTLLPNEGGEPKFAQLYIYNTDNEFCNRKTVFSNSKKPASATSDLLDTELIEYLKLILDSNNQLVKTYRHVRDQFVDNPHANLKLRLKANRSKDGRTYNLPTSSEVASLIRVVESKKDGLQRISELHPSYLALQYPLLFPFGEDGYWVDILHREGRASTKKKESKYTMREYFAYHVQDRVSHFSLILNARRLLQQFLVDVYTMIESERLLFIRLQQNNLRSKTYENLRKLGQNGNPDMSNVGTRVLLPSSFTGGSRYMRENYYDAMAICKWFGYPDFFIRITCNPKWPEIKRFLKNTNINPEDRPDILCRLVKIKLDAIMKDLREKSLFGNASAVVYTIEFQKRGLPHAHICLFLNDESKLPSVEHVDNFISAEIPDNNIDPDLYTLVSDYMIHGPCGVAKPNCPCMVDGNCSKNFPKKFCDQTTLDLNGYPVYRRADSGFFVEKSGIQLDNRSVVPYSKTLLRRYQAHINVEWCNQVKG